jgi:SnoaL-like domain
MTEPTVELLYRNLQEVFGEGDAARRRAAIEEFYTDDCVLYVPDGVFVGHDALDKFAGELRATHPHFAYTPHGEPQALHNGGILGWGSGPKGEPPEYTGLDVVVVREGKIAGQLDVAINVIDPSAAGLAAGAALSVNSGVPLRHSNPLERPSLSDADGSSVMAAPHNAPGLSRLGCRRSIAS